MTAKRKRRERARRSPSRTQSQEALMRFCPARNTEKPYPSHAGQWRSYHGAVAWLHNPWTGTARDPRDIGSDPFGLLIAPNGRASSR
jgi:hypothetical protein